MKLKFYVCIGIFLCSCFSLTGYSPDSISTEERPTIPKEIYGPEGTEIALILGNGGAGPTCVLQALSEDFILSEGLNIRIGWIQTISRLTLENLKEGVIDISLTYESEPELNAIQEGWATERTLVFNDHFILVGPKSNSAGILTSDSPEAAFIKIANHGKLFSRDDLSGSNQRERSIWENLGLHPWESKSDWYITGQVFPADALHRANKEGLYTITDRGTLLANKLELSHLAVYLQKSDNLMNRCHAMLQAKPTKIAQQFLEYLKSERAQTLISTYVGKIHTCVDCCPLFTPAGYDEFLEADCLEKLGFKPNN